MPIPPVSPVPVVGSAESRWDNLPYLKTWLISAGVSMFVCSGLWMLAISLDGLFSTDEESATTVVVYAMTPVQVFVSFLVYRWSLQKFLLPHV